MLVCHNNTVYGFLSQLAVERSFRGTDVQTFLIVCTIFHLIAKKTGTMVLYYNTYSDRSRHTEQCFSDTQLNIYLVCEQCP